MSKLSCVHCFLLVLVIFASLVCSSCSRPTTRRGSLKPTTYRARGANSRNEMMGLAQVDAARCQVFLGKSHCNLLSCKAQCFQQWKGTGVCVANAAGTDYACSCVYNC